MPLAARLTPLAQVAASRLGLKKHLALLVLCLDDIAPDERIWLSFGMLADPSESPGKTAPRRSLTLYLHPSQLLKDRPAATALLPSAEIWEMRSQPREESLPRPEDVSRLKVERFLYHQLLSVCDLCDGTIQPGLIPAGQVDAFQELWSVTIDARLRQRMLPGFSLAERRRRFSRVFGAWGVLMPVHWQVFHELWEGQDVEQDQLLHLLRSLPRLGPRLPQQVE
jgi:hypothetical protein